MAGIPRRASGRGVRHLTDGQMQKGSEGGQLSCQLLTRRALGVGLGTLGCGRGGRAPFDRWSNAGGLRGGHPAASQPGRAVAFDRWSNAEGGLGADASCRRKEAGLRGGWACRVLRALVLAAMRQASFTHLAGYPGEGPWLDEDAWDFDAAVGWQEAAGQPEPTHLYASSSSSPLPPWKPGFGTWRVVVVPVKRMPPTPGPRGGGPWVPVSRHTRYRNHSRRHTATCRPGGQQTERRGRMQCSRCLLRRTSTLRTLACRRRSGATGSSRRLISRPASLRSRRRPRWPGARMISNHLTVEGQGGQGQGDGGGGGGAGGGGGDGCGGGGVWL